MKGKFDGEDAGVLGKLANRNLRNAASWRIASEICRRHPQDTFILDAVPIVGVDYDCLRVARLDGAGWIEFNRNSTGSAHRLVADLEEDVWPAFLMEWISVADRRNLVRRVSEWFGLPRVAQLPPTTRRTLAYRALVGFLQAHAMDRHRWSVDGAALVDDMDQPHRRHEFIKRFKDLRIERPKGGGPMNTVTEPAFSVWFICRNESPLVYVTAEAQATNRKGVEVDLFDTYSRTKRIDDVIAQLASLMPR
jgi:hypothetical protein